MRGRARRGGTIRPNAWRLAERVAAVPRRKAERGKGEPTRGGSGGGYDGVRVDDEQAAEHRTEVSSVGHAHHPFPRAIRIGGYVFEGIHDLAVPFVYERYRFVGIVVFEYVVAYVNPKPYL